MCVVLMKIQVRKQGVSRMTLQLLFEQLHGWWCHFLTWKRLGEVPL